MRRLACVFLVACAEPHSRETSAPLPAPRATATVTIDAGEIPEASAPVDAHVARPSPYAPVAHVIESPDKVEAFALSAYDFLDSPPGTARRVAGYPIVKPLPRPPESFVRTFASIVLADDAYRPDAVACALSDKHVGLRFVRGADIVEISILAACPSVSGQSTVAGRTDGQLEGDGAARLAALLRATYPTAFSR